MVDTYTTIWNRLLLRAPAVGAELARDLVRDAFQQFAERREWSWLIRHSAFFPPTYNLTDAVSVSPGSPFVTSTGGFFVPAMVGQQIRLGALGGTSYPTYTILQYLGPSQIMMDSAWVGPTLTNQPYQVFQCYFPVPADFKSFYSLVNTTANYRLWTNLTQAELDLADPQRVQSGITFAAAFYDYTQNYTGTVAPTLQVVGTGSVPNATTSYGFTYPADSIYSLQITTGGIVGTAVFQWKQDGGPWTAGVVSDTFPIDLSNGVQVFFPAGTYNAGDVFVVRCNAQGVHGVPRYELWPRPINAPYVYPFIYNCYVPELTDANPSLPEFIANRGDVLLEMALAAAARFPGQTADNSASSFILRKTNQYYDLQLAQIHEGKAEKMINELELKDDDVAIKNLVYKDIPFYPAPWLDGSWLQRHAIYPNS